MELTPREFAIEKVMGKTLFAVETSKLQRAEAGKHETNLFMKTNLSGSDAEAGMRIRQTQ